MVRAHPPEHTTKADLAICASNQHGLRDSYQRRTFEALDGFFRLWARPLQSRRASAEAPHQRDSKEIEAVRQLFREVVPRGMRRKHRSTVLDRGKKSRC